MWGWLKLTALSSGPQQSVQFWLKSLSSVRYPPVMDQQKHQLPSKAGFVVEVTMTVYARTVKYGTCCLTMCSSTEFSFLRVQAPLPR